MFRIMRFSLKESGVDVLWGDLLYAHFPTMIKHLRRSIWIEDRGWIEENGTIQITKDRSGEVERTEGLAKTAENHVFSAFKFDLCG
jgi:hypothetical protein